MLILCSYNVYVILVYPLGFVRIFKHKFSLHLLCAIRLLILCHNVDFYSYNVDFSLAHPLGFVGFVGHNFIFLFKLCAVRFLECAYDGKF